MRRLRVPQAPPGRALFLIFLASAVAHALLALTIRAPTFLPDEWLYAALSRSVFHGPFRHIHGGVISSNQTISYLGPVLTSPLWLLHDVTVAYRLSQAIASCVFAAAVFPAFVLARRVGVSSRGALVVAALSQAIPAGVFTGTLLAEPYAYPVFLLAVLAAVEAVASPSARSIALLALATVVLALAGGLQFVALPAAALTTFITTAPSRRQLGGRLLLMCAAIVAVAALVTGVGAWTNVSSVLDRARAEHYPLGSLLRWYGVNTFALAVAAGWTVVPAGAVGIAGLTTARARAPRALGHLSVALIALFLFEAALWGANGNGVYERFTFYACPLISIGFVYALESPRLERRAPYAVIGYTAAAAALLLPLTSLLLDNLGHSPTLIGLTGGLLSAVRSPPLVWAPLLGVAAVAAALFGRERFGGALVAAAFVICIGTSLSALNVVAKASEGSVPRGGVAPGSALVVSPTQLGYSARSIQALFWNPAATRLLVLNSSTSPDMIPGTEVTLSPRGFVDTAGRLVPGPFAIEPGTIARSTSRLLSDGDGIHTLLRAPKLIGFGWYRGGFMAPFADVVVAGSRTHVGRLTVHLTSIDGSPRVVIASCDSRAGRVWIRVPGGHATLSVRIPQGGVARCRFVTASGAILTISGNDVVARARISVT